MKRYDRLCDSARIAQELDDLLLHLAIEGRGRLVENDDPRLQDHGAGNGDALALAAGKFMRIAVAQRGIELHFLQGLRRRAGRALAYESRLMHQQALGDDLAGGHARRQ